MKLKELFLANRGVIFGENHSAESSKKFVIQNAAWLKERGFNVMFLEHLTRLEHQPQINQYYQTGVMPEDLKKYLLDMSRGHSWKDDCTFYYDLVVALKDNGIGIICLEESLRDYKNPNQKSGRARIVYFNEIASRAIQSYSAVNPQEKWLAFIGTGHVNKHASYCLEDRSPVPGVADRVGLHTTSLIISDAGKAPFSPSDDEIALLLSGGDPLRIYNNLEPYKDSSKYAGPDFASEIDAEQERGKDSFFFLKPEAFFVKGLLVLDRGKSLAIDSVESRVAIFEEPNPFLSHLMEANKLHLMQESGPAAAAVAKQDAGAAKFDSDSETDSYKGTAFPESPADEFYIPSVQVSPSANVKPEESDPKRFKTEKDGVTTFVRK